MNANTLHAAIVAALAATALAACNHEAGDRTVGQKIDSALQTTQEKVEAAGEKTKEKLAEMGAKTEQAMPSGEGVNDTAITASIKTDFLKDPDLSVLKIDVDTKAGVVTLNGLTSDEVARARAEKMASAVKGVKEVRNFLVVKHA